MWLIRLLTDGSIVIKPLINNLSFTDSLGDIDILFEEFFF